MPKKRAAEKRAAAELMIDAGEATVKAVGGTPLSTVTRETLITAFTQDLSTECDRAMDRLDARIEKLETQTHLLAEGVIAMAEPTECVATAINAIKDEMVGPSPTDPHVPDGGSGSSAEAEASKAKN